MFYFIREIDEMMFEFFYGLLEELFVGAGNDDPELLFLHFLLLDVFKQFNLFVD